MDEPTLQGTLRQKYNINDRLLAEGMFVGLIGDHAASLVCLGLGIRCLVVAKVVLSGEIIDYDLISISPLPLLSLSFQNKSKKIKISSQFKPTQIFQMCSSAHQAEIWDNFTSTIKDVYLPEQGDTWCSTTLLPANKMQRTSSTSLPDFEQTPSVSTMQNSKQRLDFIANTQSPEGTAHLSTTNFTDFEQQSPSQISCFSNHSSTLSYRSISSLPKFDSRLSESSVSLPSRLPSQVDENNNWIPTAKICSVDLLDVKFDSFVNEVPPRLNGCSYSYVIDTWNGSTECIIKESDNKLNVSNNFIEDIDNSNTNLASELEEKASEKSLSRVRRFFKKAWCCCTGKKTTDN